MNRFLLRITFSCTFFPILAATLPQLNPLRAATNYTDVILFGSELGWKFGSRLDSYKDTLAVGFFIPPHYEGPINGYVYIYKRLENVWHHTGTLDLGADSVPAGLALSDYLLVGVPNYNSSTAVAYLYPPQGTNWLNPVPIFPPDPLAPGRFGASVAMSGSISAIAAPAEDQGVVYVYEGLGDPTWRLQARLTPSDTGQTNDTFSEVKLSGKTLLVDSGDDAYVFEGLGTNWHFQARLAPPTTNSLPGSAALDRNVAVVNSFVFVRQGTNWIQTQQLLPSVAAPGSLKSAAIEGNTIVISEWNSFPTGTKGAAFVFQFDGSSWRQVDHLAPAPYGPATSAFGETLDIHQGTIFVGDPDHWQGMIMNPTGAVYVWTPLAGPPSPASATAEIYNGFVVGINITDPGAGYTYPPFVRLIGGGTGASARAILVGDRLQSIQIVNSGTGYTSPPTVFIQSPSDGPGASESLGLRISYATVTFPLVPGKRYSLESSFDQSTWTALGEPFIAQQESLTEEFPVEQTGRLFRVVEIGLSPN